MLRPRISRKERDRAKRTGSKGREVRMRMWKGGMTISDSEENSVHSFLCTLMRILNPNEAIVHTPPITPASLTKN